MIQEYLIQQFSSEQTADEIVRYHLQTGGKFLRGRLALAHCESIQADPEKALLWAAACELLHNATLVHDDIQDNDPLRRGQASVWKKYGVAQAINAGDLLLFKAFGLAAKIKNPVHVEVLAEVSEQLVHGQSEELCFLHHHHFENHWQSYLAMAEDKTGALFQLPILGIDLLVPGRGKRDSEEWLKLGVAYQIFDDIHDFNGLKQEGQKQKDFYEKRINALVAYLSQFDAHKQLVEDYLNVEAGSPQQDEVIAELNRRVHREALIEELKTYAGALLDDFVGSGQELLSKKMALKYFEPKMEKNNYVEAQA